MRILPPRGTTHKGDQRLWKVTGFQKIDGKRTARIEVKHKDGAEVQNVPTEDLVVVAEFRDYIYPGLVSTGKVTRGGDKPFHTVINAENYHALEALTYTHRGKIDAIYIDPPYNTGAKDWKYNNDYVEGEDIYRHSKWLRRLLVARELLNPSDSVLIVTIDEKEYLRLGLLLEQVFPDSRITMVSAVINRSGVVRAGDFTRINEYVFLVVLGDCKVIAQRSGDVESVRWASLRRFEDSSRRHGPQPRPDQFYPIYVRKSDMRIDSVGDSIGYDVSRESVPDRPGCLTLWPLKPNGTEMIWGLTPATTRKRLAQGFVKVSHSKGGKNPTLYYLTSGQLAEIDRGELIITGRDMNGVAQVEFRRGKATYPSTQWDNDSHQSKSGGAAMLAELIPGRRFPFPKSLFAVEDALRFFVLDKPAAVILDFFSGSGTTAHAVMRLNKQDGGRRQCISVTNNEVAADEQKRLREQGLRPGDTEWDKWGICDYITKPRIAAAITGKTPEGVPINGDYKFTDEFPMADGFEENAEFFTLTYETPVAISHNHAFSRIASLLWMRAGSSGRRIEQIPEKGWDAADTYGLLTDLDQAATFGEAVNDKDSIQIAFIVTDDDRRFESIARRLPKSVEPVRLYESYLSNFRFSLGQ